MFYLFNNGARGYPLFKFISVCCENAFLWRLYFCLGVRRLARIRCLEWNDWSDLRTRNKLTLDFGFLRQGMLIIKTFQLYLPKTSILSKICKPLFSSVEQELHLL